MIKEKYIKIILRNNNISYYKNKLSNLKLNINDKVILKPEQLTKGSHKKITAICDVCGKEKEMMFKTYIKNTNNLEKEYYCFKCNKIRLKEKMMLKYGYEHALQNPFLKEKRELTCLNKYGYIHPMKNKVVREKFENTLMKKYGVKNALEYNLFLEKLKNKNGLFFVETEEFKKKSIESCLKKYGQNYYIQSSDFKEKSKKYFNENFGVDYPMQCEEIYIKSLKNGLKINKYKNYDIFFQGSYEKDFLNFCEKLNILNLIERGTTIRYNNCGKEHLYFSDFKIKNTKILIEIKSDYTYNLHLELNIKKHEECINKGFNHIFIINKNYENFYNLIKTNNIAE